MKWMLITAVLSNPVTYPTEDICKTALKELSGKDPKAVCIPAGEDKSDKFLLNFVDIIEKLQALDAQKTLDSNTK